MRPRQKTILHKINAVAGGGAFASLPFWSYHEADAEAGGNNDLATSWSDLSGNARHLTQGGATSIQKKVDAGVHSFYLGNAGSARYVRFPTMSGLTEAEIFVVMKSDGTGAGAGDDRLLGLGAGDNDSYYAYTGDGKYYAGAFSTARKDSITMGAVNVLFCLNIQSAASLWKLRQSGTERHSTATNTFEAPTLGCLGATNNNVTSGRGYNGRVYAVYVMSRVLTAGERTTMQEYITNKYGITFA
jgi:hypothetical protein